MPSPQDDTDLAAWNALDPEVRERLAGLIDPSEFTLDSGREPAAADWRRMNEALDAAEGYEAL